MRILHADNFYYQKEYGTELYIRKIMQHLGNRGHENRLFIQNWSRNNSPLKALYNTNCSLKELKRTVREFCPDIIHIHNITNYRLLEFFTEAAPCLKSVHELRPFCTENQIKRDTSKLCEQHLSLACFHAGCFGLTPRSLYRYRVERRAMALFPRFSAIWVFSRYMKRMIERFVPEAKRLVLNPYFHDPGVAEPDPPAREPRIFAAGRMETIKGFDLLLHAAARMEIPVRIVIAGDGPEKARLEELSRELKLDVTFLGYLANDDLGKWFSWSRITAFPSIYPEPFGLVGLEAMGAGRPVVAFDVGGVSDWLEHGVTGILVERMDVNGFRNSLKQLIENDDLAAYMGRQGWMHVRDCFSFSAHLTHLESVYHETSGSSQLQ